jgi:hypothetical protein
MNYMGVGVAVVRWGMSFRGDYKFSASIVGKESCRVSGNVPDRREFDRCERKVEQIEKALLPVRLGPNHLMELRIPLLAKEIH